MFWTDILQQLEVYLDDLYYAFYHLTCIYYIATWIIIYVFTTFEKAEQLIDPLQK